MTGTASPPRADPAERRYLNDVFADLCRIESPSQRERGCAERVRSELAQVGVSVQEDGAGTVVGCDSGNLLARIPASQPVSAGEVPGVLLCAHLDTVPPAAPVEPVLSEGAWENANATILGADNKAAVAVLLAVARRLRRYGSPVAVELLFTVAEELSLAGARAFDAATLQSDFGYVFDHASPIGEVIVASPTHYRLEAAFRGRAAHAGIRPEEGRSAILAAARAISAIRLGRLDEETTANVGTISGGSAINVVPADCALTAEVRSFDPERAEAEVAAIVDRLHEAANRADSECDLDVAVERTFAGYRQPAASAAARLAREALRECGYEPTDIRSGGGSDANALITHGLPTVNVANGTEHPHEPGERVTVEALEGTLDVALALLHRAGMRAEQPAR